MAPKIGLVNNQLQPPPNSPNCRSSMTQPDDSKHYIAPLTYTDSLEVAKKKLMNVLKSMAHSHLIKQDEQYWHFEFRTPMLKFTDDVEFYFPAEPGLIHMRSASRVGYSDWGTNLKRLETIRSAFKQA
jgi:uncharacterized protein (DUF1499 family)